MKKSNISDLVLAITYSCNSKCRMCNIWQKTGENEIKPYLLNNLPENLKNINLTGGEPFLHSDLEGIIKKTVDNCPKAKIIISSNGFATELIVEQMKKILKIMPNIGIAISLDGIGIRHDEIRGIPGGYEKTLKTLEKLKNLDVKNIKIAYTLGEYNFKELPRVYNLAKNLGIEFSLAAVHSGLNYFNKENILNYSNDLEKTLTWLINQELNSWSLKKWARAYFTYGLKQFIKTNKRILPDYSGKLNIFIDPRGDIYPCDIADEKIGNLKTGLNNLAPISKEYKSWMVCTVRPAMKKHWIKVGVWILKNKFFSL